MHDGNIHSLSSFLAMALPRLGKADLGRLFFSPDSEEEEGSVLMGRNIHRQIGSDLQGFASGRVFIISIHLHLLFTLWSLQPPCFLRKCLMIPDNTTYGN